MTHCSICRGDTSVTEQAFVDGCFHVFCYDCIVEWSEKQRRDDAAKLLCPLCRTEYRSVFHSCVLQTFSRHWFSEGGREESTLLTPGHLARRAVYCADDPGRRKSVQRPVSPVLKERRVTDAEAQKWIRRELEALLLVKDVDFLLEAVTRIRGESFEKRMETARLVLEPFLGERKVHCFMTELDSFLASGLNVRGYDAFVEEALGGVAFEERSLT